MKQIKKKILIRINEVLHYIWDPLHVSGIPEARDEYDSYATEIFSLCLKRVDQNEITNYLTNITIQQMGLSPAPDHDDRVAGIICEWLDFFET